MNVEEVFFSIAKDIKQRLAETDSKAEVRAFQTPEEVPHCNFISMSYMTKYLVNIDYTLNDLD